MEIPEEVLIAEWKEKTPTKEPFTARDRGELIGGATLLAAALLALGIWRGEIHWYIAAVAVIIGMVAIFNEKKRIELPRTIQITNQRILVEQREYTLEGLAGFRLEQHEDVVVIMFDNKKPTLLPLTVYYQNDSFREAHDTLVRVLTELPPKEDHLADQLQRLFPFK